MKGRCSTVLLMPFCNMQFIASDRKADSGVVSIHRWECVMKKFKSAVQAFIADEDGVTAIEYGLIAALIGVGMATAASLLGVNISKAFEYVSTTITNSMPK
jgi:pilus assembly protein Flp/PilA